MSAKTLMVLGSMSSAGKSLLATGLCRLYARRGWRVRPFKAQNMSNNAAVCAGGEIGRAQAVQAYAAGVEPSVDMNPILLKPEADARSQVILRGQVYRRLSAGQYYQRVEDLWPAVTESLERLRRESDLVILEGAGSPAELNLRGQDLVNLRMAQYAQAPCLLVGDIERGGIFAQLLGTLWLLEEREQPYIKAFVVNKFRGDAALFTDGVRLLAERGGRPVLGVLPYLHELDIPDEDAAVIRASALPAPGKLDVAVIHLPHIANFDDFDPLRLEPGVGVRFVEKVAELGHPRVVFLPGTKNTAGDLRWLFEKGLAAAIRDLAQQGTSVIGFCGGFQMLGMEVHDELGVESAQRSTPGLGLLPVRTRMTPTKTVTRSRARILCGQGFFKELRNSLVEGYEIHLGDTQGGEALLRIEAREGSAAQALDGACSPDGRVWGTHLHGLLENDHLRRAWLHSLGVAASPESFRGRRAAAYDRLADALEAHLDMAQLDRIIAEGCNGA
ncbi:MAG: adenosylcobyric acid synthase [Chloroflexota bacterium]|nr:adenosylcobyric acid synthase [Chloroflexota bacterium]